jgi:uncharacterized OB-fold protein
MRTPASAEAAPLTAERQRFDDQAGTLVAGQCDECGSQAWPRRSVCHRCGSRSICDVRAETHGRLVTWTRVWVPVEGIEPPYIVGLVELGRLQLFGHVRGADEITRVPQSVRLRVDVSKRPPFWFEVTGGAGEDLGPEGDAA